MSVEAAIVARLAATPAVTAIVADRVAAVGLPDKLARPNLVYQTLGTARVYSNDGPAGLARATLQVSCYADDYKSAKQLAKAVRDALNGFAGTSAGIVVQSCLLDDERDAPQPPSSGQTFGLSGVVQVFNVAYDE